MTRDADDARRAVLKVIESETEAYFNKDYEAWARCWVHEPYTRRLAWYARIGGEIHQGWEMESALMRASMQAFPAPSRAARDVRRENINIRVGKDMAWATFEQVAPVTGDAFDTPGRQHEGRVLEKHDRQWKIACCFVVGSMIEIVDSPLVQVDPSRRVLWMNAAAATALKAHRTLDVVGGRLTVVDRQGAQRLQASIAWAARLESYADFQNEPQMRTRRGTLPVFLGQSDAEVPEICWVVVDSGMILISFDDDRSVGKRLESAAIVYGITPAQLRLVGLIIVGHDLVDAARRLGVSANTARTQLQRMFDKTGVRTQPALVRALLSVAAPLV